MYRSARRISQDFNIRRLLAAAASLAILAALAAASSSPGESPPPPCPPGAAPPASIVARDGYGPRLTATHEIGLAVSTTLGGADVTLPRGVRSVDIADLPDRAMAHFNEDIVEDTFGLVVDRAQTLPVIVKWTHTLGDKRDSPTCLATTSASFPVVAARRPTFTRPRRVRDAVSFEDATPVIAWSMRHKPATADLRPVTIELRAGARSLPRTGSKSKLGFRASDSISGDLLQQRLHIFLEVLTPRRNSYEFRLRARPAFSHGPVRVDVAARQGGRVLWRLRTSGFCGRRTPCVLRAPTVTRR